jgi:hypothetical protein
VSFQNVHIHIKEEEEEKKNPRMSKRNKTKNLVQYITKNEFDLLGHLD